ncbi:MAG: 50S ribosomal protein L5 [Candidatus Micrarchaeia archaeon]
MPMRDIRIDKVVVNIGVGKAGEPLENAQAFLERLTGTKAIQTKSRSRNPTWGLRRGLPIGTMATLRGQKARDFLKKAFEAVGNKIRQSSFDTRGNFSFGVKEYIDFPGVKYDPKIGMLGFDVCVSLVRPGYRVARKKIGFSKIGKKHLITKEEAQQFVSQMGVTVLGESEAEG